jgi:hypothetical protein
MKVQHRLAVFQRKIYGQKGCSLSGHEVLLPPVLLPIRLTHAECDAVAGTIQSFDHRLRSIIARHKQKTPLNIG